MFENSVDDDHTAAVTEVFVDNHQVGFAAQRRRNRLSLAPLARADVVTHFAQNVFKEQRYHRVVLDDQDP
jgi:hypothetical protein